MREIKFRAWNKKKKCFIYHDTMNIKLCDINNRNYKDILVCQEYTGLKDKNGVEIYEGDIVLRKQYIDYVDNCHFSEIKGIIEMYNYAWCVIRQCDGDTYTTPLFMEEEFGGLDKIEVIGNIYENKDLLEELE